ncbi:MAG: DUF6502 family protein [Myxococcota bacterium]
MAAGRRQPLVIKALRRLFRPLVRFLITEQITYPMLGEILKSVYVEVADREFRLEGKSQTASRVALLTGVHRREVQRRRSLAPGADEDSSAHTALGARLVADWLALPQFLDDAGEPLPLNRSSRRAGPSIRDLAETAGQDIRPQALLDEWLRLGVVELDDEGRIRLRGSAFVPEHGFEEKIDFFARILSAHFAAGTHNLAGEDPPMLDQVVYHAGLSQPSSERLQARARELASKALKTWNREARSAQAADAGAPDADRRIHFGAYFHVDRSEDVRDDE